ncbi:hypothetical protein V1289_003915 [Bradyrhizobium sp. AZCC 2289]
MTRSDLVHRDLDAAARLDLGVVPSAELTCAHLKLGTEQELRRQAAANGVIAAASILHAIGLAQHVVNLSIEREGVLAEM